VHQVLGGQRLAALKVGLLGAYLGRGSMLFAAAWVVRNKWLLLLGGLYLIYLAISHFGARTEAADEQEHGVRRAGVERGFWAVVVNVELADLAFSLDNVVAAVALSRDMWVILTGVFLGIVTMRFAAGIFVKLIRMEPMLEAAAYLLVLAIGLELLGEELYGFHLSHGGKFAVSLTILILTLLYARWRPLRAVGRRLRWIGRIMAFLNASLGLLLRPLTLLIGLVGRGASAVFGSGGARRRAAMTAGQASAAPAGHPAGHPPGDDGGQ
jgi:tellurite resistance protein TerC